MTAGWVLPRDWDAGRLLRFITGLAMLALAFAANAGLTTTPVDIAPAAPATVEVSAVVDDAATGVTQAPAPAVLPTATGAVIEIGKTVGVPTAVADPAAAIVGAHGSRAPPAV
jgi:hypothetical protein